MLFLVNGAFFKRLKDRTELSDNEYKRFLKRKSLLSTTDIKGQSALIIALENGHLKLASALIERGDNIRANKDWNAAFFTAVWEGYTDVVAQMIQKGADINTVAKGETTMLMFAAANGHTDIARLLIQNGSNINIANEYGNTALFFAGSHRDVVELMLQHGADINTVNKKCSTFLDLAEEKGYTDIVRLLVAHGAKKYQEVKKDALPSAGQIRTDGQTVRIMSGAALADESMRQIDEEKK